MRDKLPSMTLAFYLLKRAVSWLIILISITHWLMYVFMFKRALSATGEI